MADERRPEQATEQGPGEEQGEAAEVEQAGTASGRDSRPRRPSGTGAADVEQDLDDLLADVKRERDEYLALAQRARADFENYRKRAARDTEEAERRGKVSIARELLAGLDNLQRALRCTGLGPRTGRPVDASEPTFFFSSRRRHTR